MMVAICLTQTLILTKMLGLIIISSSEQVRIISVTSRWCWWMNELIIIKYDDVWDETEYAGVPTITNTLTRQSHLRVSQTVQFLTTITSRVSERKLIFPWLALKSWRSIKCRWIWGESCTGDDIGNRTEKRSCRERWRVYWRPHKNYTNDVCFLLLLNHSLS